MAHGHTTPATVDGWAQVYIRKGRSIFGLRNGVLGGAGTAPYIILSNTSTGNLMCDSLSRFWDSVPASDVAAPSILIFMAGLF